MLTSDAPRARVLIADDQPDLLDALRLLLKSEGIQMEAVTSPQAAVAALRRESFDLLLMDLNYTQDTTSGAEGIDLLARVRELDAGLPVMVMTGWGSVDLAVEAMRRGVRDFVRKPWDNQQLLARLRAEIDEGRAVRRRRAQELRDIDEARRIQRQLLPAALPQVDGWELAAAWQPAGGVGGDCYDALRLAPARLGLSIADVMGKGVSAALLMSNLQATVRAFADDAAAPATLCGQVNRILCRHIGDGRFISFFYCILDVDRGTIRYANAGHFAPMVIRGSGQVERLTAGGPVLGVLPDAVYEDASMELAPGDRLILFTDGITEARHASGEEFGEERLSAIAVEHRESGADAVQAQILAQVSAFAGGAFHDDTTLIVLGRLRSGTPCRTPAAAV